MDEKCRHDLEPQGHRESVSISNSQNEKRSVRFGEEKNTIGSASNMSEYSS